ncbi:MAG: 1-phosphofructokinase, partial [Thermoleophilaceae bacterium]|nr:1-phosphofructokinase [Thermoleophilaceae bacterium]
PTSNEQTEITERGPAVSEAELDLFVDKLLYLAKGAGVCVFSGSLPRGVPDDLYARLIADINRLGCITVLDAEGEALRLGTRAEPTVVTPNEPEAEELVGHEFAEDEDRSAAVREITELGAREAIMTLPTGCVGLLGSGAERILLSARIDPGVVEARSAVGSGDAFLAGFVAARYGNADPEQCLRFAVGCGAESIQHFGAGVLDPREVDRLLPEVQVERLPEPALSRRS